MRFAPQTIPAPGAALFCTTISTISLWHLVHNAGWKLDGS
jgi:hypothetical protein